jgi:hypothetical protein
MKANSGRQGKLRAAAAQAPGICKDAGAGDNGYFFLISPEITGPNCSLYSPLNFDICICSTGK